MTQCSRTVRKFVAALLAVLVALLVVPTKLPGGTWGGVAFDGYDPVKKELLDPKSEKWSTTRDGLRQEMGRQLRAAGPTNTPIRWHFARRRHRDREPERAG